MRTRVRSGNSTKPGWYGTETQRWDDDLKRWEPYSVNKTDWALPFHSAATITDVGGQYSRDVKSVYHLVQESCGEGAENRDWQQGYVDNVLYRWRVAYGGYTNQSAAAVNRDGLPGNWLPASSLPHREAADFLNEGGVKTEMSLANFLLELPEIISTFGFLRSKGLKKVSGGALSYNFGIKPLIGDLQTIANYAFQLQKRLEWLKENAGKTVGLTFRKTLSKPDEYIQGPYSTRWKVLEWSHTYTAFGNWRVDYDPIAEPLARLKHFNQYFGTKKLLTAVWEAIPFSFVVDWFTNAGELFKQFELPSTLSSRLVNVGWSQKVIATMRQEYNPSDKWYGMGTYSYKRYERSPGLPLSLGSAVDLSTATGRQQALLFALIHQKW